MKITYSHQGKQLVRTIANETVLIGRGGGTGGPDLDLSPDIYVSRKHAMLTERHGAFWIEDLSSKLGTTVNGKEIKGQGEWRLRPGDIVMLGDTMLQVEAAPEAPPSAAVPAAPAVAAPAPPPAPPPPPVPAPAAEDASPEFHIEIALNMSEPAFVPAARPGLELERRLALFLDLSTQLGAPTSLDHLLQAVLRRVMDVIPEAERGAVLLRGTSDSELLVKACVSPDGPAVSGTLARRALEEGRGFIWRRNMTRSSSNSIAEHHIATGIYAPLRWQDQALGVICLDTTRIATVFNRDDLRLLMAVAQYAALAVSHFQVQAQLARTAGPPAPNS
jgi:adenylate cyclase